MNKSEHACIQISTSHIQGLTPRHSISVQQKATEFKQITKHILWWTLYSSPDREQIGHDPDSHAFFLGEQIVHR
jgi:hypothetical protein